MSSRLKGFVGPSYLLRNIRFDCQRCINMYPEVDESMMGKNAEVAQLTRTPGLTELLPALPAGFFGVPTGLALYVTGSGAVFQVASDGIYLITGVDGSSTGWTRVKKASISPVGPVRITDNGISLFVTDDGHGWALNLTTFALTTIANCNPTSCTFLDGYVLFSDKDSNRFYWTDLYSSIVQATNFASAEANPDEVRAIFNNNEDLWVFGRKTTELWYNSGPTAGSTNTTFTRRPGILVETGLAAVDTVQKLAANRIAWLSIDDRGGPTVVMAEGYLPTRISTFAIEQQWSSLSQAQVRAATAYTYTQDGHLFYCLNIPGLTSTWCYDLTTSMQLQQPIWHERQYTSPFTGTMSRHRAEGHAVYLNKHIVSDYENGAIYFLDQDAFTDNSANIKRVRVAPHIANDGKRLFYNWLQLDIKTGMGTTTDYSANPTVLLEWSNDGGTTWSNAMERSAGRIGEYISRVIFNQLGQSRDRVFRVTMTDPIDWAISGAAIDITPGAW